MKMKKIGASLALLMLLAGTAGLSACKDDPAPEDPTNDNGGSENGGSQNNGGSENNGGSGNENTGGSENTENQVQYEDVSYNLNFADLTAGKPELDKVVGVYTIAAGSEIRDRKKDWTNPDDSSDTKSFVRSIKLNGNIAKLSFKAQGPGKAYIYAQNGSGSAQYQTLTVTKPDGTTEAIKYEGVVSGSKVHRLELEVVEGVYSLQCLSGTTDVYLMEMTCKVEKSDVTGIEIANQGCVDYAEGQVYDKSEVVINKVYGNGRRDPMVITDSELTVDTSAYNANVPGSYNITFKYKDFEAVSLPVKVWEIQDITLGLNKIVQSSSNTKAGNGQYINETVKQVYQLNSELNTDNLTLIANTKDAEGKEKDFIVSGAQFSTLDTTTAGTKEVTVTYNYGDNKSKSASFNVYVVNTEPSVVNDVVQVKVDKTWNGVIGEVSDGYNMFTTIQAALEYLKAETTSNDMKLLEIAAGTYNEKIEVTIPNLEIKGAGKDQTIIEWDSLYGLTDEAGFVHTTDSTQTVAIREGAVNCTIRDITISNYWNSVSVFDEEFGKGYGEHRALAILIQSDKFRMFDSALLGYQDTIELFTGRQYFENTYIAGTTDFIFGTNSTTYFTNCEIHSISSGKTDGGYITAFKGMNKGDGSTDYVQYGTIFDGCHFTADEDVVAAGNTAIARPWGFYSAVMVMNSELDGHISTKAYSGATKNERYVGGLSDAKPSTQTVKFFEYNNTGAGSITESITGCTVLTDAAAAANYNNLEVIFGTTNGMVTYDDAWDPSSGDAIIDTTVYYWFNGSEGGTGTNYTFTNTNNLQGQTINFNGLTIDATAAKFHYQGAHSEIQPGVKITLPVEAGDVVEFAYHNSTYAACTEINGIVPTAQVFSVYYTDATTMEFEVTNKTYLWSISVKKGLTAADANASYNPNIVAVDAPELTKENKVVSWTAIENATGYLVTLNGTEVGTQTETSYTLTETTPGVYTITVTALAETGYLDSEASTIMIRVVEDGVDPYLITENSTISFGSNGNYKDEDVAQVVIDYSNASSAPRDNGGSNSQLFANTTVTIKVKAGATIVITSFKDGYTNYTYTINGGEASAAFEGTSQTIEASQITTDSTIVFTSVDNDNYLYSIAVTYPVTATTISTNTSWTNGATVDAANGVYGLTTESANGLTITGSDLKEAAGCLYLNTEDAAVEFTVAAGATIVVTGYDESNGKLDIYFDGVNQNVTSNGSGVYTISTKAETVVTVKSHNVGTEETPSYNKGYLKSIVVTFA